MQQADTHFLSPEPEVTLVHCFARPFDNAVAAARTCYSSKGIVTEATVAGDTADEEAQARARARRDALARDIFHAGHHTNFQHAHVQFALSNVSRQFVWSFLHAHPFYNSEQVSQRYVAVQSGAYAIPPLSGEALACYEETIQAQFAAYHTLCEMLVAPTAAAYYDRFPARANEPKRWEREITKKAMEVARYVLPVATFTYLYHTLSCLTLLRYHRLCRQMDTPLEQQIVVEKMVACLLEQAPEYAQILEEPLAPEEMPEYAFLQAETDPARASLFRAEFDASLDGRVSKLVDWKQNNEAILAQSVREVLGLPRTALADNEAIRLALDPARNPLLGETLNMSSLGKLTRCLTHPSYTFSKKLSHTADSQDQRHRMTPASRPVLALQVDSEPDYIVPALIARNEECRRRYVQAMEQSWEGMARLRALGVPAEFALYLLPNATAIRFSESADLINLRHKHAMRLCYNAQEEIWRATVEEAQQIRAVNPEIGAYLLPPCGLRARAGKRPPCPEGSRYCGVPAWQQEPDIQNRLI